MAAEVSARAAEAARIEGAVAAQIEQATQSLRSGDLERARATLEQAQDNLPRGSLALKEGIHRLRNDLDMVLRLEDVLKLESFTAGKHENSAADSAYLAAFQTYDLDLPRLDPAEAAARVKASKIQSALVTALDDWLFVKPRTDITGRERLLAVVKLADSDPWRQQLRDPATQKDRGTLERLARDGQVAKQPPSLLVHLGKHLAQVGASDSSVNLLRRAEGIYPNDYWVNYALAVALAERKPSRPVDAAGFARAAAALRPQSRLAHYILGRELAALDQASEAEIHFRRADELASSREPRCAAILAADAVQEMTRTDYARAASLLKVSIDMLPRNDAGRKQLAMALTEVERLARLEKRLPEVLRGEYVPADPAEKAVFAQICLRGTPRYAATSARLYSEAFAADRRLLNDMANSSRYNAACAAVLAAAGQGEDAANLDAAARAAWRKRALGWLRGDLAFWTRSAGVAPMQVYVRLSLTHWQNDPDLASIRNVGAVAALPEAEQQACRDLWREVAELLAKTPGSAEPNQGN